MSVWRPPLGRRVVSAGAVLTVPTWLVHPPPPHPRRKIIGAEFIHVFEEEAVSITAAIQATHGPGASVAFLLQGTLYPDVIESVSFKGPSATIKSHHNVGGLLAHMKLKLIEPLRELFKDEVRALGIEQLGLPRDVVFRHPFPGPGLAIRILGEVTPEACAILREADDIFLQELRAAGEYEKIAQAFAVLLPCRSVGVMGDGRTYEKVLALRAVATSDYMTADCAWQRWWWGGGQMRAASSALPHSNPPHIARTHTHNLHDAHPTALCLAGYRMPYDVLAKVSTRIINEVRGVNRVVYDVSSKPPATIEWE